MGLCDCGEILDTSYGGCKEKLEKIKRLGEGGKRNDHELGQERWKTSKIKKMTLLPLLLVDAPL